MPAPPRTAQTASVQNKIYELQIILEQYQGKSNLFIIPFQEIQKEIIVNIPADYRMILYRRCMMKIAEKFAKQTKAKGLITGDCLGQVASQTLENIHCVHSATKLFIASPLLGFNKREIMDIAKKIGTYETSILPYEDCCSMFIAQHPVTRAILKDVEILEEKLDLNKILKTRIC